MDLLIVPVTVFPLPWWFWSLYSNDC